jgi:hypothetical protein
MYSQEADTAFGEGHLVFRHIETLNPLENVDADYSALEMDDTVPTTIFTGTSDAEGKIPFEVPVCIDSTVGLKERYKNKVKVFPSPGSDMNIHLPQELSGTYSVQLFDIAGRKVLNETFTGNQAYIPLHYLAEGVYAYSIQTQEELVASGKTVKLNSAPGGKADYQGSKLKTKTTGQQKDLSDCEAVYLANYDAPDGYVDGTTEVTITDGINPDNDILVQPWDTAYASGNIITLDEVAGFAKFIPLTLTSQSVEEIFINYETTAEIDESGDGSTYTTIPVAINTTGGAATTNAVYEISWPSTLLPIVDSTSLNLSYIGWEAGETTLEFSPGNNSNKFITLQRQAPPEKFTKRHIEGYVGRIRDASPGSVNTPADGAIVVIQHDEGIDTLDVDANGYFISPEAYDDGEQLYIGAGYPGSTGTDGLEYHSYKNIDYLVQGANMQDLAANDTTKIYKMNLLPKEIYTAFDETLDEVTALEILEMDRKPQLHVSRFDTVGYHINTTGLNAIELANINMVIEQASEWTPITYVQVDSPFENLGYDYETASTFSHGANIVNGDNNLTNIQQTSANIAIQGNVDAYISAQVNIDGEINRVWKELVFQYLASADVASRPSAMNSDASYPTAKDFRILNVRHFIGQEMYNATTTPNVPFDTNNQTQNISINYISDSVNITPQ